MESVSAITFDENFENLRDKVCSPRNSREIECLVIPSVVAFVISGGEKFPSLAFFHFSLIQLSKKRGDDFYFFTQHAKFVIPSMNSLEIHFEFGIFPLAQIHSFMFRLASDNDSANR